MGTHTVPPHTTKRRTTTNLKTKNNQNWQKIKLYRSLTTKELKKKHSFRVVGGAETGSHWEDTRQGSCWQTWQLEDQTRQKLVVQADPHLHANKSRGTGKRDRPQNPGFQCREIKPQNFWLKKLMRVEAAGETPSLTRELTGETHRVLEDTRNHPPGNQHQKDPICLWVAVEVTKSQHRAEQVALFPLGPLPNIQCYNAATWGALPWRIPKAPPLTM